MPLPLLTGQNPAGEVANGDEGVTMATTISSRIHLGVQYMEGTPYEGRRRAAAQAAARHGPTSYLALAAEMWVEQLQVPTLIRFEGSIGYEEYRKGLAAVEGEAQHQGGNGDCRD